MATPQTYDVLISGGGLIGQTLALALARHGLTSAIVDPADPALAIAPDFDGRATAIASAAWAMFDAIGLADRLRAGACPIRQIWVSDGLKPGELDFVPAEDDGALGQMVENRALRRALFDAVRAEPAISLCAPAAVTGRRIDDHAAVLTLADGRVLRAPLLLVAEGRRSPTRDALGFAVSQWSYHHHAIIGAISHADAHDNIAYEIFYPAGPFALLPLADLADGRHRSAFVWSVAADDGPGLMKLGDRGFTAELAQRMGGMLGDIAMIAPRQSYPLGYHRSAVITARRAALVGDAAHGIHPIAGQGLNLGLRDVATLVEVLVEGARAGLDLGDAALLARYQRWRGLDSLLVAAATDGLTRLFGVRGRLPSAVRRMGLGAVQRMPALKSFFMNEARGETGDLPKLLTGELV
ncbi:MAG: 2-octaprenyl-6-methoxyphenyl hydroxylase [Pseudomonadota bacterium]